jgi:hypothetical protein
MLQQHLLPHHCFRRDETSKFLARVGTTVPNFMMSHPRKLLLKILIPFVIRRMVAKKMNRVTVWGWLHHWKGWNEDLFPYLLTFRMSFTPPITHSKLKVIVTDLKGKDGPD